MEFANVTVFFFHRKGVYTNVLKERKGVDERKNTQTSKVFL